MRRGVTPEMVLGVLLVLVGLGIIVYHTLFRGGTLVGYVVAVGERVIGSMGLAGVAGLMTLESCAIPVPSEVVVPLAAARYASGDGLAGVVLAATAGNLLGSTILYYVGLKGGRPAALKLGLSRSSLERAERLFAAKGNVIVLLGRMMPAVRTYVSLPAGMAAMSPLRFLLYTLLGSVVWNVMLAGIGMAISVVAASTWVDLAGSAIAIALGLALVLGLIRG